MVGLGNKLTTRNLARALRKCAENNDWRVELAGGGSQFVGRGAPGAVVALGVQHNQVGSVKICQMDGLFGPLCFDGHGATTLEQRAQDFARLGRLVDDQYAWQAAQAAVSIGKGRRDYCATRGVSKESRQLSVVSCRLSELLSVRGFLLQH